MDDLARKACCKIVHYQRYDSDDTSVNREEIVECTDVDDNMVELAFDLRPGRQRTYLRMNREDLLRMIRLETP